jgi:hypothetical protein
VTVTLLAHIAKNASIFQAGDAYPDIPAWVCRIQPVEDFMGYNSGTAGQGSPVA